MNNMYLLWDAFASISVLTYPSLSFMHTSQRVQPCARMEPLCARFRAAGWAWDEAVLLVVVDALRSEGIVDIVDLVGLDLCEIPGSEQWNPDVREFVLSMAMVGTLSCPRIHVWFPRPCRGRTSAPVEWPVP